MNTISVTSESPGRIRVRDERLTDADFARKLIEQLDRMDDVHGARINTRVGSLLLTFEPALGVSDAVGLVERAGMPTLHRPAEKTNGTRGHHHRSPATRSVLNLGMLGALGVSLGALAFGAKAVHYGSGIAFIALLAGHVGRNASRL